MAQVFPIPRLGATEFRSAETENSDGFHDNFTPPSEGHLRSRSARPVALGEFGALRRECVQVRLEHCA